MTNRLCGYHKYRLMAFFWMAFLFWLSSQPDLPGPSLFSAQDKVEHVIAFGILGLLFALSLGPWKGGLTIRQAVFVILLVTGYGCLDELHQSFVPGRCASISDMLADSVGGVLVGLILYVKGRRFFQVPTS